MTEEEEASSREEEATAKGFREEGCSEQQREIGEGSCSKVREEGPDARLAGRASGAGDGGGDAALVAAMWMDDGGWCSGG